MICRLSRDYRFEAAHFLPHVPEGHRCLRMHGHSYALTVTIEGQPDERGWIMDFAAMDEVVEPLVRRLDHQVLNEVAGLDNPTAELLAAWVWRQLEGRLPVVEVEIAETQDARCVLRRG